jgi:hypothetical protein
MDMDCKMKVVGYYLSLYCSHNYLVSFFEGLIIANASMGGVSI